MSDRNDVLATLDEYADAYCEKDVGRLMKIFVDGDGVSLIGTGADELCAGRKEVASVFERNFQEATATSFEWNWQDVAIHGSAATVATTLNINLEIESQKFVVPIRWTVSLVRIGTDWKWVHRHASVAAGAQNDGKAYPVDDN